ncbi:hypothetical protein ACWDUD_01615 [Rhodococcus sp. NPDC003382]|uniref:hypothetical protein n=1 Tax=Rhodococcus sp. HM1 TaxID=2937759 RepID=UPI00200B464E|nr:hypothetical protein [Rhodococcus sp. HM1]MCK8675138.1 hypothetical protein [Rhodococcus sp. HM1]
MGEWLLALFSPERIQALGIAATSLLTAWMTRQAAVIKRLQAEVAELKAGRAEDQRKFRRAIWLIRDLLSYATALELLMERHIPHVTPPQRPEIPAELLEEV